MHKPPLPELVGHTKGSMVVNNYDNVFLQDNPDAWKKCINSYKLHFNTAKLPWMLSISQINRTGNYPGKDTL